MISCFKLNSSIWIFCIKIKNWINFWISFICILISFNIISILRSIHFIFFLTIYIWMSLLHSIKPIHIIIRISIFFQSVKNSLFLMDMNVVIPIRISSSNTWYSSVLKNRNFFRSYLHILLFFKKVIYNYI